MQATARVQGPAESFVGVEKRAEHRRKMLKGGTVHFNKGYSSLECVIRDVTSTGVRIQMGETFGMPSRVLLAISGEEGRVEASVRWRNSRNVGLSFAPTLVSWIEFRIDALNNDGLGKPDGALAGIGIAPIPVPAAGLLLLGGLGGLAVVRRRRRAV